MTRKETSFATKFAACVFLLFSTIADAKLAFFDEPAYSFEAVRALSYAPFGGADVNECLDVIANIEPDNDQSWYQQWYALAERLENEANKMLKAGHQLSARDMLLRASNYYRTAEFFLRTPGPGPKGIKAANKSRETLQKALPFFPFEVEKVQIPFEETTLPGYLILAKKDMGKKPLLIVQTGFDGTAEELFLWVSSACVERGYHCLIVEGPGQGAVIRDQHIPFRHNWETVVTPIVDFALENKQVDEDRIGIMGISFGGYLIPRALAFEHRIKLGVVNGGVFDFHKVALQGGPDNLKELIQQEEARPSIDESILKLMQSKPLERWFFSNGMFTFQAKSPMEFMLKTQPYELSKVATNIKAKMLVIDSKEDVQMKNQSKMLFEALTGPKSFMMFTKKEGAGLHCQIGALKLSRERIFNWIDEHI